MRHLLTVGAALLAFGLGSPAFSQANNASPTVSAPAAVDPPPKVRELLDLMGDPQVRAWLDQRKSPSTAKSQTELHEPDQASIHAVELDAVVGRLGQIRSHMASLIATLPHISEDFRNAGEMLASELQGRELWRMLRLFLVFIGLGYGFEWLFRRATTRFHLRFEEVKLDTVGERLNVVGSRLAFAVGLVLSFAAGSVGAFLAFDWPYLIKDLLLGYLLVFLAIRLALAVGRFLLAPRNRDVARFRIVPMTTAAARFWYLRLAIIVGWVAFGRVLVDDAALFGISLEARELMAYGLGLVLLAIAVECAWRAPPSMTETANESAEARRRRHGRAAGLSLYFVVLWLSWVVGAMTLFWVLTLLIALPAAIRLTQRSVNHILRPPGHEEALAGPASVASVCLERGLRTLLIVGAIFWLAYVWHVDVGDLASSDTLVTRILRGLVTATIVILVADFVWNVIKAVIDTRVTEVGSAGELTLEEDRRRARLRTLLPILRNMLFVVIVVIAVLMGLSSLGIQIAPLIASAGVVGVAIGFGAQTLVKDVISGIFYLLDDAFRVGEYIQSGNYRGVVESFSLRSVKLRHQNGPLYTVPFGVLGAIQNMSRDWAIEKLTIGVTYDTDIDKARKIIKKVGQELAQDPELAPGILEPLKMQGVQAFGDFAIQVRMKMMTRPGDVQFAARRRALAMIKKAFDANGISFAYPTVQVAGGATATNGSNDAVGIAVAQKGLELVKPAAGG
jgi:moderate conductance mechanosensitive channel